MSIQEIVRGRFVTNTVKKFETMKANDGMIDNDDDGSKDDDRGSDRSTIRSGSRRSLAVRGGRSSAFVIRIDHYEAKVHMPFSRPLEQCKAHKIRPSRDITRESTMIYSVFWSR